MIKKISIMVNNHKFIIANNCIIQRDNETYSLYFKDVENGNIDYRLGGISTPPYMINGYDWSNNELKLFRSDYLKAIEKFGKLQTLL